MKPFLEITMKVLMVDSFVVGHTDVQQVPQWWEFSYLYIYINKFTFIFNESYIFFNLDIVQPDFCLVWLFGIMAYQPLEVI